MRSRSLRPEITLVQSEHRKLLILAAAATETPALAAESLLAEMERAVVVPDGSLPPDVVAMGSRVRYRTDKDEIVEVTLVYPADGDDFRGKVSVLTPLGAALIGLRTGQSITWDAGAGEANMLTVLSVVQAVEARRGPMLKLVSHRELPENPPVIMHFSQGDDDDPGPSAA